MKAIRWSFSIDDLKMIIKLPRSQTNFEYHHAPPILSKASGEIPKEYLLPKSVPFVGRCWACLNFKNISLSISFFL